MNIYGGSIAKAVTSSKQENGEEEEEKRESKLFHQSCLKLLKIKLNAIVRRRANVLFSNSCFDEFSLSNYFH